MVSELALTNVDDGKVLQAVGQEKRICVPATRNTPEGVRL